MKVTKVAGIPPALLDNYCIWRAEREQKWIYYSLRWNSDIEAYFESGEFIEEYGFSGVVSTISNSGYKQVGRVNEVGEFSLKGDVIAIWQPGFPDPVRIEFFGNELEEITSYDALTGRSINSYQTFPIFNLKRLPDRPDWQSLRLAGAQPQTGQEISAEFLALVPAGVEADEKFDFDSPPLFFRHFDLAETELNGWLDKGYQVAIQTQHKGSLPESLRKRVGVELELPFADIEKFETGILSESRRVVLLTDRELFGTIFVSQRQRKLKSSEAQQLLSQLEGEIEIGDYVVHQDYGVGVYQGFQVEDGRDYLRLEYAEEDELFVPLEQLDKLTKYLGDSDPNLTRLGKNSWGALARRVKAQVAIAAKELARHYAKTKLASPLRISAEDSDDYAKFTANFEFEPTVDQLKAEREIIADLAQDRPMARLLVGDVGFGKTEVIQRAAFKIVEEGGQVVVLCPTTVLALQHYRNFQKRYSEFPIEIGLLSRQNSAAENKATLERLEEGKLDIAIGTHRLLSSDTRPKKLALLVIDEEQRFGVRQKEKIRELESGVHSLSVSATPIPRTLSMALSAIQDISLLTTPPPGRKPVKTQVAKHNWTEIARAIQMEVNRGGQVLYVHNRVQTISSIAGKLQELLPEVKFGVGHGQLAPAKLDQVMTDFYNHKFDCLIATTIVENGLDLPNVNTIIITEAQNFGLSQLHQLRGRVGRGGEQAHCFIFFSGRTIKAQRELERQADSEGLKLSPAKHLERLEAIISNQDLGAGFRIASKDLEIRGAGNLLGSQQHGNISQIGYGLYMQMLAEEIERLKLEQ